MSNEVPVAHVEQYKSTVQMLVQQQGSRLRGSVRIQDVVGKSDWTERVGPVAAVKKVSRHSDSPLIDTPHSRRRLDLDSYEWGDMVDTADKVRLLIDPISSYSQAASWAMGRAMDEAIIAAATGNAVDKDGTNIALTAGQKIAVDYVHTGTAEDSNMTVSKLRETKRIFMANEVDENIPLHIVVSASQIMSLLRDDEVTSRDFTTFNALVTGDLTSKMFMGLIFHHTELLVKDSNNVRKCFAWAQNGITLGIGDDIKGRIGERSDKSYGMYAFYSMDVGSTRNEEEKVVEILADEDL